MTIPASTVLPVLDYLEAQITAAVTADVSVIIGPAGPGLDGQIVAIGEVIARRTPVEAMVGDGGQHSQQEEYTVQVKVSCVGGDDFRTIIGQTVDLVNLIEVAVRSDLSLGELVLVARPFQSPVMAGWDEDRSGPLVEATVEIEVLAEL